jgi:hypothetical protein
VNELSINNGNLNVTSSYGAGIGTARTSTGNSTIKTLKITGGTIVAQSANTGAGIGAGGTEGTGVSAIGDLRITGSNVTANGSTGIGSGAASGGTSSVETLVINGGNYIATGAKDGAGIGTGSVAKLTGSSSSIGTLQFTNGTFQVKGFVGVGAPNNGYVGKLTLSGQAQTVVELICTPSRPYCYSVHSLVTDRGTTRSTTNSPRQFDPLYTGGIDKVDLRNGQFVGYYPGESELEHIIGSPTIHLVNLSLPVDDYTLEVKGEHSSKFSLAFNPDKAKSLLLSVGKAGTYVIEVHGGPNKTVQGDFCSSGSVNFQVKNDEVLFANNTMCPVPSTTSSGKVSNATLITVIVVAVVVVVALVIVLVCTCKKKQREEGVLLQSGAGGEA